ncbi:MAG: ATP-grasp domain-containing protein [Sandaracinaceae bacterium]|nr:ATP-grasp domain-containing protein [Sandaracinaceae bacterium]
MTLRNVVFAAPFPLETTMRFARAAARLHRVRLLGVMQEMPRGDDARIFADIVRVDDGLSAQAILNACRLLEHRYGRIERLVGVLEALQVQLAEVRSVMGIPGTDPHTATLFREKALMKDTLRAHGLPTARHRLLRSWADAEAFAREVGFPIVLKPPAGMGAKVTFRVSDWAALRSAMEAARPSPEHPVLAEEFLKGREFSLETITIGGEPRFISISHYMPSCLEVLENPWIQWTCLLPRDISGPEYDAPKRMGVAAVRALGLEHGFTHMEWFQRTDGSLAIGEIAQRPPGANITKMVGLAHDFDPYHAWARAVIDHAFDGPYERKYAVGCAYLRGMGRGRVARVTGLEAAQRVVQGMVEEVKLPTIGAPKNDSYEGDGYVIIRHLDTEVVKRGLRAIIENVRVEYA